MVINAFYRGEQFSVASHRWQFFGRIKNMNTNQFIRLNTAFNLPENITERVITLSRKISRDSEVFFVLDGIQFHPHITVYSPEYPESKIEKVLKIVKGIAINNSKVNFKFKHIGSGQGFISLVFDSSSEIKKIHEETIQRLNPLREGHIRQKYQEGSDYHVNFTPEQKENINKYGYPDSMSLYFPHLTIIRLKDESSAKTISEGISWEIPEFQIDKLAVYRMGEHGTCRELVKEFSLR